MLPVTRRLRPSSHALRVGASPQRGFIDLAKARAAWQGRLVLAEEVEASLAEGRPVVALESTIITHGMPHPTNLSCATSIENILRSHDVTPATIALLDGKVHVGLVSAQLERLADPDVTGKYKMSRRDLAPVLSRGAMGGTTVASTMYIAQSVGIGMFVTGGIGGVHRGAESSMDISADLIELGRTPMAVVCAGAKSILDIPRTLEVLETHGVCVATYGDALDFPAFYTPSSGLKSPWNVTTSTAAAELIHASLNLPTPLSTLLAVPIPSEYSAAGDLVQEAVEQAVRESFEQGIAQRGKEVTPWLLKRVGELTGGSALDLNVKLIENNAHVGAQVARELARMQRETDEHASSALYYASSQLATPVKAQPKASQPTTAGSPSIGKLTPPSVLVFGSAAIDITSSTSFPLSARSTTPGSIHLTPGGVGRNIAESAQKLLPPQSVQLISPIGVDPYPIDGSSIDPGPDSFAKVLMEEMRVAGIRTDGLVHSNHGRTAACSLTLEKDGDLVAGVADMGIVETMTGETVATAIRQQRPKLVAFDCNVNNEAIQTILTMCLDMRIPTFCDPTSIPKLPRLANALLPLLPESPSCPRPLTHLSPNLLELDLLYAAFAPSDLPEALGDRAWEFTNSLNLLSEWRARIEAFTNRPGLEWLRQEGVVQKAVACLPWVESLWVKVGPRGLLHLRVTSDAPSVASIPTSTPSVPSSSSTISQALSGIHSGKHLALTHYPPISVPVDEIVSTTGAGDTLVGGLVAGLVQGREEGVFVREALEAVGRTMRSRRAVG